MRPEVVVGIDPGGNGTTGIVVCREWQHSRRAGMWIPHSVDPQLAEIVVRDDPDDWSRWVWEYETMVLASLVGKDDVAVYIEDAVIWQRSDENLLTTIYQIGAFDYVTRSTGVEPNRVLRQAVCGWLLGGKVKNRDGAVDEALLDAYGGKYKAVGAFKCDWCRGLGRRGRGSFGRDSFNKITKPEDGATARAPDTWLVAHGGKWYKQCETCEGSGLRTPPGPLHPLWKPKSRRHCRAALAVALYGYNLIDTRT